jgi:hypothetical protein
MRHTTIVVIQQGKGFMKPGFMNNEVVKSMLSKSYNNYVVFSRNQNEYMAFTEQHPLFNILVLSEGNAQIYEKHNFKDNTTLRNYYYDACDIIEDLYKKAAEVYAA